MSRFLAQVQQYQANNRGNVPTTWDTFLTNYLRTNGDDFTDPSGDNYVVQDEGTLTSQDTAETNKGNDIEFDGKTIHVYHAAQCGTESVYYLSGSATRKIAILYKLEGAGIYCGQI